MDADTLVMLHGDLDAYLRAERDRCIRDPDAGLCTCGWDAGYWLEIPLGRQPERPQGPHGEA